MYKKLKSTWGQIPKLYGLARTHKNRAPLRPIVAIIEPVCDRIGCEVAKGLNGVDESRINYKVVFEF